MINENTSTAQSTPLKRGERILQTSGLSKNFGKFSAVKDLNLELFRGEVFGFLGPNGAGKSTTVGMILGLIEPTAGKVEIFGHDFQENPWSALRRIGAIIEEPAFYPYLSGWDNLTVLATAIGGIPKTKISEVLERVNLLDRAKDKYSHYSLGMKQRLGIASTLLRDPELIILDEPTSGLDPAGTKEVRDLIPQLAHESRSVFLCSHFLHEVEMVCDRVAIIKQGVMIANATVYELITAGQMIQIKTEDLTRAAEVLRSIPWIKSVKAEDGCLILDAGGEDPSRVNRALAEQNIYVSELVRQNTSLESVFLQLTGGETVE